MHRNLIALCACVLALSAVGTSGQTDLLELHEPPRMTSSHYIGNREPLEPSRLLKLPAGSIRPGGWLRHQLRLQAEGFHGHLREISPFLQREGNAWLSPTGSGERGWEEVPYWLKGYLNCALVLDDEEMLAEAKVWIEGAIASQQEDGWFGPDKGRTGLATSLQGREDLWPNMIMLFCLMDYHDASGDGRVIELMRRYFRYLEALPEDEFLLGYWPRVRGGDQLHAIHWLYNRTGEPWLLDLAAKTHRNTARWDEGVANWHNVNIAQGFREPTQWWVQSHDPDHRGGAERVWNEVRRKYGRVPGGMFGADENARPGFDDPRQCIETCGIVEEMLSYEILLGITGDMAWADRCEDVAFNMLPASFTADMGGLRYLTAPNQPVSDAENHSPGIQNGGPMFLMSPHRHRCCQHNAGHGWPYYAQHLWYATPDGGLAAILLGESAVTATVGDGSEVTIRETSGYPFEQSVSFTIETETPTRFPFYVRIPGWCSDASIRVNGELLSDRPSPGSLRGIEREWANGDSLELALPMITRFHRWEDNHGALSVHRGPLTYSLDISAEHRRIEDAGAQNKELTDEEAAELNRRWPAFEILPSGAWNYGLVLTEGGEPSVTVAESQSPADGVSPWTPETSPVRLKAAARRIPAWQIDMYGLAAPLQDSPAYTEEPVEQVSLIPMGAARIRVSAFPVASDSGEANRWEEPRRRQKLFDATASHTYSGDQPEAVADGIEPVDSGDQAVARHTFWPHKGTLEWLQAGFENDREISAVSVYWFDDGEDGECRVPESWRVLYRRGDRWLPVATSDTFSTARDTFNTVTFEAVETDAVRLEIQLQPGFSAGVLEWTID